MTEGREVFLVVASYIPLLLVRLGKSLLRTALLSRRGAASFQRALKNSGMDTDLARRLTQHYRSQISLRSFIRMAVSAVGRRST